MKTILALLLVISSYAKAGGGAVPLLWIDSEAKSCFHVCKQHKLSAVMSGVYVNNKPYFVCSTNAGNAGHRPGYNIPGFNDNSCGIGYGSAEQYVSNFRCLCQTATDGLVDTLMKN